MAINFNIKKPTERAMAEISQNFRELDSKSSQLLRHVRTGEGTLQSGTVSGTFTGFTETINHNLGYVPLAMVFITDASNTHRPLPYTEGQFVERTVGTPNDGYFIANYMEVTFTVDENQLIITQAFANKDFPSTFVGDNLPYKYYLFREPAT